MTKTCKSCGKNFDTLHNGRKFCDRCRYHPSEIRFMKKDIIALWEEVDKITLIVKEMSDKLNKIHFIEQKVLDTLKKNPNLLK